MGDEVSGAGIQASEKSVTADVKTPEPAAKAARGFVDDEDVSDSLLAEFWLFLKEEKKWWLAPLVIVLLVLSAVIVFAEGSAIAPFIYTIF